jgi:hypothetical protein
MIEIMLMMMMIIMRRLRRQDSARDLNLTRFVSRSCFSYISEDFTLRNLTFTAFLIAVISFSHRADCYNVNVSSKWFSLHIL